MSNFEEKGDKTFQDSPDDSKSDDQEVVLNYSGIQGESSNDGENEPSQKFEDTPQDYINKNPNELTYAPNSQNQNEIKSQPKIADQSQGSSLKDNDEADGGSESSHHRGYNKRRVSRSRSRDKYKPLDSGKNRRRSGSNVRKRSGFNNSNAFCCSKCRTKKNGKTCVCVVPRSQRRVKLTSEGCRSCGCKGCTKEDHDYFGGHSRRRSHRKKSSMSSSSEHSLEQNIKNQNFNNFQNSSLGGFIVNQMNIYPPLLGFGVPQRTSSYILGYSKTHSHSKQKKHRR